MFDLFDVSEKVISLRMSLHFRISPRGPKDATKYFVIGHPRTGTTSLHNFFKSCGLNSLHTSKDWPTKDFDCFSDKGQNRPFKAYDAYYENAKFILNCRPVEKYLLSLEHVFKRDFPVKTFEHEIRRRSKHFDRVLAHFQDRQNLLVVNIEKPGAMDFIAQQLGLQPSPGIAEQVFNKAKKVPSPVNAINISRALDKWGIDGNAPLLSPGLSQKKSLAVLEEMTANGRVYL